MSDRPERRPTSFSQQIWLWMFTFSVTMLVVLGWAFLYLEPGTPSYVIGQVSAIALSMTVLGTLIALYIGWQPF